MANNWMSFRPSRRVPYIALVAVIIALIAIAYRRFIGDDWVSLALGILAILAGVVAYALLHVERRRWIQGAVSESQRYTGLSTRGRKIGWLGAAIVVGSFAFLGTVIFFFGASQDHMLLFQIWLIIFLVGFVLLWYPTAIKWGIMLGIISTKDEGGE